MSGLPDFLDLPSIQAQLRELGHDVSLEKVEGLLVELGFAGSQGELALPPAAAADIPEAAEADAAAPHSLDGLLPQMAHLQVADPADEPCAAAGEEEQAAFVWRGWGDAEQPALRSLLPAGCGTEATFLTAHVPRTAFANTTNSPTASSARQHKPAPWRGGGSAQPRAALQSGQQRSSAQAEPLPYPSVSDGGLVQLYAAARLSPMSNSLTSRPSTSGTTASAPGACVGSSDSKALGSSRGGPPARGGRGRGAPAAGRPGARPAPQGPGSRSGPVGSSSRPGTGSSGRRRADPVSGFLAMQRLWAKDKFLQHGGGGRVPTRKRDGFREMFSALHALEAARR